MKAVAALTEIAQQLEFADRERMGDLVGRLAGDKEAFVRWNVAIAVGKIGHPSGVKVLEGMVGDEHANVRFRVALALRLIGHVGGVPILEKMVSDTYEVGGHFVVRAFTALALGKIGDESGVQVLAKRAHS